MTSQYGWTITQDHLSDKSDPLNRIGTTGPSDTAWTTKEILEDKDKKRFVMYDDDDERYYTGYIVGDYSGFEPLDDFGAPDSGCTGIKYHNKNTSKFEYI